MLANIFCFYCFIYQKRKMDILFYKYIYYFRKIKIKKKTFLYAINISTLNDLFISFFIIMRCNIKIVLNWIVTGNKIGFH